MKKLFWEGAHPKLPFPISRLGVCTPSRTCPRPAEGLSPGRGSCCAHKQSHATTLPCCGAFCLWFGRAGDSSALGSLPALAELKNIYSWCGTAGGCKARLLRGQRHENTEAPSEQQTHALCTMCIARRRVLLGNYLIK